MKKLTSVLFLLLVMISQMTNIACATEENPVVYHKNNIVNQVLIEYNAIAEHSISSEMVKAGVRKNNANMSCNGVWIQIWEANNGEPSIDFDVDAAEDDTMIFPVFRDFAKVMNPLFTDEQIDEVWKELQSGRYEPYDYLYFENTKMSYWKSQLNNGKYRYSVSLSKTDTK